MNTKTDKARELYRVQQHLEKLGVDPGIVPELYRKARRLRKFYEDLCNGDVWEEPDGTFYSNGRGYPDVELQTRVWIHKNIPQFLEAADNMPECFRWPRYRFQRDPRGASIYIVLPDREIPIG